MQVSLTSKKLLQVNYCDQFLPVIGLSEMAPMKSIAIIGAGPAGAITVDALSQEQEFDSIRVFERREKAGGCWFGHIFCMKHNSNKP
jgi:NADPH-dependent glutamate synthase beta subunit-like oxidoreductase